ncbi:MAG: cytochrome c1 [Pseudomonadota bacterium]
MRRCSYLKGVVASGFALAAVSALGDAPTANAAGGGDIVIKHVDWSFGGVAGQYDPAQLRRGFQVFSQVCANCHGLERVAFRSLSQPGGPEFTEEEVKAIVAEWPHQITDGPNDDGEMFQRQPKPFDIIKGPWANEKEARASNGGAYPLDLSLIVRARTYGNTDPFYIHVPKMAYHIATGYEQKGANYLYSLLVGYKDPPEGKEIGDGLNYNVSYPGNQIAMSQPIYEGGAVEYAPNAGAPNTMEAQSEDVTAFLAWAADPHLNTRKATGWQVMLYLIITTTLLWLGKQRLWARVKKQGGA